MERVACPVRPQLSPALPYCPQLWQMLPFRNISLYMRRKLVVVNMLYCCAMLIVIVRPLQVTYFHILTKIERDSVSEKHISLTHIKDKVPYCFMRYEASMTVRICVIILGYDGRAVCWQNRHMFWKKTESYSHNYNTQLQKQ